MAFRTAAAAGAGVARSTEMRCAGAIGRAVAGAAVNGAIAGAGKADIRGGIAANRRATNGNGTSDGGAKAGTEIARVDSAPLIAISGRSEAGGFGATLQDIVGRATDNRADGAANALHGDALGRDLANDAIGLCLVVNSRAWRLHHLHRAAAQ